MTCSLHRFAGAFHYRPAPASYYDAATVHQEQRGDLLHRAGGFDGRFWRGLGKRFALPNSAHIASYQPSMEGGLTGRLDIDIHAARFCVEKLPTLMANLASRWTGSSALRRGYNELHNGQGIRHCR